MADETRHHPVNGFTSSGERRPPRSGPGGGREGGPGGRKYFRRKKVCKFCVEKIEAINYKDVRLLAQFVAESGKIVPRRLTGVCTPHQRRLSVGDQAGAQHRPAAVRRTRGLTICATDLHGFSRIFSNCNPCSSA